MTFTTRTIVLVVAITAVVAALSGWAGVRWGLTHARTEAPLDILIHNELDLTPEQAPRIEALEADFASQRSPLVIEMRVANRDLASAIEADHTYNSRARAAVSRFHRALEQFQELTIRHVLAMRRVLTPDQAAKFDHVVHRTLTDEQS